MIAKTILVAVVFCLILVAGLEAILRMIERPK